MKMQEGYWLPEQIFCTRNLTERHSSAVPALSGWEMLAHSSVYPLTSWNPRRSSTGA